MDLNNSEIWSRMCREI